MQDHIPAYNYRKILDLRTNYGLYDHILWLTNSDAIHTDLIPIKSSLV